MDVIQDPILFHFRTALDDRYKDRIEKIVLFGSRARGDNDSESDYDVAVFITDIDRFDVELAVIADIETEILYETGKVINGLLLKAGSWGEPSLFMQELRRDGVEL